MSLLDKLTDEALERLADLGRAGPYAPVETEPEFLELFEQACIVRDARLTLFGHAVAITCNRLREAGNRVLFVETWKKAIETAYKSRGPNLKPRLIVKSALLAKYSGEIEVCATEDAAGYQLKEAPSYFFFPPKPLPPKPYEDELDAWRQLERDTNEVEREHRRRHQ